MFLKKETKFYVTLNSFFGSQIESKMLSAAIITALILNDLRFFWVFISLLFCLLLLLSLPIFGQSLGQFEDKSFKTKSRKLSRQNTKMIHRWIVGILCVLLGIFTGISSGVIDKFLTSKTKIIPLLLISFWQTTSWSKLDVYYSRIVESHTFRTYLQIMFSKVVRKLLFL